MISLVLSVGIPIQSIVGKSWGKGAGNEEGSNSSAAFVQSMVESGEIQ